MTFDAFVAVRLTPHLARLAGWANRFGRVAGTLGFRTRNPTAREFVVAVRTWQEQHPLLAADGLLGPRTWKMLMSEVQAYSGSVPTGRRPGWVTPPDCGPAVSRPPATAADSPEDRALLAVLAAWPTGKVPADLAKPVSPVETTLGREGGPCGLLRVGQVWPGVAGGHRTIVAATAEAVAFVTDGGQEYRQPPAGWEADYLAALYAGRVRDLTPL